MRGLFWVLLGAAGLCAGCDVRRVDACGDQRIGAETCVSLQLTGGLGGLDQLGLLVSGDWVGHYEYGPLSPFELPVAVAVVLPPYFQGAVRVQASALKSGVEVGQGVAEVLCLIPGERRQVTVDMTPGDMGAAMPTVSQPDNCPTR